MRADIHKALERFGVSGPAREWVIRALHPAGEAKSNGLPDQSSQSVLRPDFRVQTTISAPVGAASWDCMIWSVPGDVNAVYYATGPSPMDFATVVTPTATNVNVGVLNLQTNNLYPYAVNYGTWPVTPGPETRVVTSMSFPSYGASAFRHQFKSFTAHLISSAVSSQGSVVAAQYSPVLRDLGMVCCGPFHNLAGATAADIARGYSVVLPTRDADIAATAPGYYTDEAKQGVYVPMRLAGPAQPFARSVRDGMLNVLATAPITPGLYSDRSPIQFGGVGSPAMLYATSDLPPDGISNIGMPWPFAAAAGATNTMTPNPYIGTVYYDTGYDNMNCGIAIFRGLQGPGGGFASSILLKANVGLEVVPNPTATDRVFLSPPAAYEPRAMEAYYTLSLELRDAYPASFNSLGSILSAVQRVASRVWGFASPLVKSIVPAVIAALPPQARAIGTVAYPLAVGLADKLLEPRGPDGSEEQRRETTVTFQSPSAERETHAPREPWFAGQARERMPERMQRLMIEAPPRKPRARKVRAGASK